MEARGLRGDARAGTSCPRPSPASRSSRSTRRTTWHRLRARPRLPGRVSVHARRPADDVPRASSGRCACSPGFGTAEQTNERFKYLLAHGQTGLSTAFDFPTLMGYDSDSPRSLGEVGMCGVAVDSLADMEILFDGIPLDEVTTSMTINGPALDPARVLRRGRREAGRPAGRARRHDPERHPEGVHRAERVARPAASRRCGSSTDMIEFCARGVPRWNPISISGYHIREAGATAAQELAFTLADGIAYVECGARARPRRRRLRAAALLLLRRAQRLLRGDREVPRRAADLGAADARALRREEPRARGAALPRADRRRVADRAAAATTSCATRSRRWRRCSAARSRCTPTRSTRRSRCRPRRPSRSRCARSRSSPHESGVANTIDPLGGCYFVEALTNQLEAEASTTSSGSTSWAAWSPAIEKGFFQREIADARTASSARSRRAARDGRREPLRGRGRGADRDPPDRPDLERKQVDSLRTRRQRSATDETSCRAEGGGGHAGRQPHAPRSSTPPDVRDDGERSATPSARSGACGARRPSSSASPRAS